MQCPLRIAAIPARLHPSSPPFSAACSSSAISLYYLSITKLDFPDRIGLSRQIRSLWAGSVFSANPTFGKSALIKATSTHKTPSRKITAPHLKPQCAYTFACFGFFRCLGYLRCFDISIVLNIFSPIKHSSLSQAETPYKTDTMCKTKQKNSVSRFKVRLAPSRRQHVVQRKSALFRRDTRAQDDKKGSLQGAPPLRVIFWLHRSSA